MKLKLAGLLLFSQAAVQAVEITKDNYKQHLCTLDSLKAMPRITTETVVTIPAWQEQANIDILNSYYGFYCQKHEQYAEAVKFSEANSWRVGTECFPLPGEPKNRVITKEACVEKTGIAYAKACEELKTYKSNNPITWNNVSPTLEACNTVKRR